MLICQLVQTETHFHADRHGNSVTIFERWIEFPFLDRFEGFFIQAQADMALHASLLHVAIRSNDNPENHGSLILCLSGLFGVLGIGRINRTRSAHSADTHVKIAGTGSCTVSRTIPRASSVSDTTACATAIGKRTK